MKEHFIDNDGVRIHALELNPAVSGTPIFIVPGMARSAEDIVGSVGRRFRRRVIALSVRGRGKSDSPQHGWSLEHQASDVAAVVNHFRSPEAILFGHSTGGTFAARAVPTISSTIVGFILGDFPPFYPAYSETWSKRILSNIQRFAVSEIALNGIVAAARATNVSEYLRLRGSKLFVLIGDPERSLFPPKQLKDFQTQFPLVSIKQLVGCGHEFLSDNPELSVSTIEAIAAACD